jgi:hypothetical protein
MNNGTRNLLVVFKSHYLTVPVCFISWCGAKPFFCQIDVIKVFSCGDRNSPFINKMTILSLGVVCLKCLVSMIEWFSTSNVCGVDVMAMY